MERVGEVDGAGAEGGTTGAAGSVGVAGGLVGALGSLGVAGGLTGGVGSVGAGFTGGLIGGAFGAGVPTVTVCTQWPWLRLPSVAVQVTRVTASAINTEGALLVMTGAGSMSSVTTGVPSPDGCDATAMLPGQVICGGVRSGVSRTA